jgi:hypothetical protein
MSCAVPEERSTFELIERAAGDAEAAQRSRVSRTMRAVGAIDMNASEIPCGASPEGSR